MKLYELDNQLMKHITETGNKPFSAALSPKDFIEIHKAASELATVPIVSIRKNAIGALLINGIRIYPDTDIELGNIRWENKSNE